MMTYVVQPGDTLSQIAQRFYGLPSAWRKLAQANNIINPDMIMAGQMLRLPDVGDSPLQEIRPNVETTAERRGLVVEIDSNAPRMSAPTLGPAQATDHPAITWARQNWQILALLGVGAFILFDATGKPKRRSRRRTR